MESKSCLKFSWGKGSSSRGDVTTTWFSLSVKTRRVLSSFVRFFGLVPYNKFNARINASETTLFSATSNARDGTVQIPVTRLLPSHPTLGCGGTHSKPVASPQVPGTGRPSLLSPRRMLFNSIFALQPSCQAFEKPGSLSTEVNASVFDFAPTQLRECLLLPTTTRHPEFLSTTPFPTWEPGHYCYNVFLPKALSLLKPFLLTLFQEPLNALLSTHATPS